MSVLVVDYLVKLSTSQLQVGVNNEEMTMDIKEEVRRRIAELTRLAYERGYRDGAQSALTEIETIAADDVIGQLTDIPKPLELIPERKTVGRKRTTSKRSKKAKSKTRAKPAANGKDRGKPKTMIVQEELQGLLDAKGQASRDEVLAAAQAKNPAISKFDLGNGLRPLLQKAKVRVSSEDKRVLLPA